MGLNCSLRKVISVEKYPEASATKGNYALPRLEYTLKLWITIPLAKCRDSST